MMRKLIDLRSPNIDNHSVLSGIIFLVVALL